MKTLQRVGMFIICMAFTPLMFGCGSSSTGTTGAPAQSELEKYLSENPDEQDEAPVELDE